MGILTINEFKDLSADDKHLVLVDARGGADAWDRYKSGHAKGAIFADLETDLSEKGADAAHGGRHPLPSPEKFSAYISAIGIQPSSTVVVYDDKNGANAAARLWWMLKSAGHEAVYVISGGIQAVAAAGYEVVKGEGEQQQSSDYRFKEWIWPVVTMHEVAEAASKDDYLVIDVRENYRYRGESEPIDLVAGHIPGAVNVPYTTNLDDKGEFLPTSVLKKKYTTALDGRDPEKVIVHCGSGVTACHTLLALSDAGLGNASLYVGSWSEWSRNENSIATEN